MLRSRNTDRSQVRGAAGKIFLRLSTKSFRLVNFLCPTCRINASALLRFAVYSKDNRPEKIMFHTAQKSLYYTSPIARLISFALFMNDDAELDRSNDRTHRMTVYRRGRETISLTGSFAFAQSIGKRSRRYLSQYVSHKSVRDYRAVFRAYTSGFFFLDKIGIRRIVSEAQPISPISLLT